ncbi:MAG: hypothetical protein R3309_10390 [Reinekea sp.]|jgi:hypothetical protein|nr:hypothetical protein [Reinekea sp.]
MNTADNQLNSQSSNLLFMRRRQAADLLISLADGPAQPSLAKNLLLDALYQIPTECFIADDWYVILKQVTHVLLQQESKSGARMPTHLSDLLARIANRLAAHTH